MKKYLISFFIPYLLLHLSGCYSMQKVTKDEFFLESENSDMILKISEREEIIFDEGNYSINRDSIKGVGTLKTITGKTFDYEHFEGSISINDIDEVRIDKYDISATIVLILAIFAAIAAIGAISGNWVEDLSEQLNE
ncbi:MAG: hypothetical protein KJN64_15800 [Ignavibacteria bacterium]|nr:hypothetical protein [Ignavibacteria bacterium]